jgi:hypothetical protein
MKTLIFDIENKFIEEPIYTVTMPFDPRRAMKGFYSKYFMKLKSMLSKDENVPAKFIGIKIKRDPKKSNGRVQINLPSGAILNYPDDVDEYDLKIIKAQLDVMKMPFERPGKKKI